MLLETLILLVRGLMVAGVLFIIAVAIAVAIGCSGGRGP